MIRPIIWGLGHIDEQYNIKKNIKGSILLLPAPELNAKDGI